MDCVMKYFVDICIYMVSVNNIGCIILIYCCKFLGIWVVYLKIKKNRKKDYVWDG